MVDGGHLWAVFIVLCVLVPGSVLPASSKKRVPLLPVEYHRPESSEDCEVVKSKCAYRDGCGAALQNYMMWCGDVMAGKATRCPEMCKKALIAIASTDEGSRLMTCDCKNNEYCYSAKERLEICRDDVMRATASGSVVSCSVAQLICAADPLCSTALDYYNRNCKNMFRGRKCNMHCNNSIDILNRQEKAEKLKTCKCDGTEEYDCRRIKTNMEKLCFYTISPQIEDIDNHLRPSSGGGKPIHTTRSQIPNSSNRLSLNSILVLCLLFLNQQVKPFL